MAVVSVNLTSCNYSVIVLNGVLSSALNEIQKVGLTGKVAIISDSNVAPHYLVGLSEALKNSQYTVSEHIIPAGEASKSMSIATSVSQEMVQAGHDRGSFVIALGGGVVGDLAGFVASIFFRGIPFVQIPTTIVSQVDSSVGGKTGVNIPEGKNLLGAFHQPKLVLIDPEMLSTLPSREYREGYAEAIKHAAIRDPEMLKELNDMDLSQIPPSAELLAKNIAIKARIVEEDEKELSGTRALLNFGHTIGHGIEAAVPYGTLLHGEAISLGLRAALFLSVAKSGLAQESADQILRVLEKFGLPLVLEEKIKSETILEKLKTDKKFSAGQIRFVLIKEVGTAFVSKDVTLADISEAIEHLRTPLTLT